MLPASLAELTTGLYVTYLVDGASRLGLGRGLVVWSKHSMPIRIHLKARKTR